MRVRLQKILLIVLVFDYLLVMQKVHYANDLIDTIAFECKVMIDQLIGGLNHIISPGIKQLTDSSFMVKGELIDQADIALVKSLLDLRYDAQIEKITLIKYIISINQKYQKNYIIHLLMKI